MQQWLKLGIILQKVVQKLVNRNFFNKKWFRAPTLKMFRLDEIYFSQGFQNPVNVGNVVYESLLVAN